MIRATLLFGLITVFGVAAPPRAGARAAGSQGAPAARPQQAYTLDVTSSLGFIDVTMKAEGARLSEVATDLAKRLGARLVIGPGVVKNTISVNLAHSPLEPALASLAPRVFVDYEIRQDTAAAARVIYLLGPDDAAPAMNAETRVASQGVLIAGHTEEAPGSPAEEPLKVSGDKRGLMIMARKQPLSIVAMAIAETLGVLLELKYDATEMVDVDIKYYAPPEDVIPGLSPNFRLHVRADVTAQQRMPIRLVLERQGAAK